MKVRSWWWSALVVLMTLLQAAAFGAVPSGVTIGATGEMLLNGKPFFPIFVWAQPRSLIAQHAALGINAIVPGEAPDREGPRLHLLNDLQKLGMYALVNVKEFSPEIAAHPALLAWMHGDEPDLVGPPQFRLDTSRLPTGGSIVIEGERAQSHNFNLDSWMNKESANLSGKRWLACDANSIPSKPFAARYDFTAPKAAIYRFFVREYNKNWARPTTWRLDGGPWKTTSRSLMTAENQKVMPDADVGWADYGSVQLTAGKHVLEIEVREGRTAGDPRQVSPSIIAAYDLFLFTTDAKWPPAAKSMGPEPSQLPEMLKTDYETIRAKDPKHPVWLNLSVGFFAPYRKLDMRWYHAFGQCADIMSFDFYPVTGWNRPDRVPEMAAATKDFVALYPKKSHWVIVEASDQDLSWTPGETRGPNPREMRAEVWMAITAGSKAIGYFTVAFEPFRWNHLTQGIQDELKRTNAQLKKLTPAILSLDKGPAVSCSAPKIQYMVRKHAGAVYLFAVSLDAKYPIEAGFTFPPTLAGKMVEVVDEYRTIRLEGGVLKDRFAPLAARVYRVAP